MTVLSLILELPKVETCVNAVPQWWRWHFPIGISIGVLALLGIVVPLCRDDLNKRPVERFVWSVLIFFCLGLEIDSIYQDQWQHAREEEFARCEQLQHFTGIANAIQHSFEENQRHFEETLNGVGLAQKAVNQAVQQTKREALVELATVRKPEGGNWNGQPFNYYYEFQNKGGLIATDVHFFGNFYVNTNNREGCVAAYQKFQHEWDQIRKAPENPMHPHQKTFSHLESGEERSQGGTSESSTTLGDVSQGRVLYFFFVAEYKDDEGTWGTLACRKMSRGGDPHGEGCFDFDKVDMNYSRRPLPKR
jgi:hypothetical protein